MNSTHEDCETTGNFKAGLKKLQAKATQGKTAPGTSGLAPRHADKHQLHSSGKPRDKN